MFWAYPFALSICGMPAWAYSVQQDVKDQHKGDGRGNVGLKIIILVIAIMWIYQFTNEDEQWHIWSYFLKERKKNGLQHCYFSLVNTAIFIYKHMY